MILSINLHLYFLSMAGVNNGLLVVLESALQLCKV